MHARKKNRSIETFLLIKVVKKKPNLASFQVKNPKYIFNGKRAARAREEMFILIHSSHEESTIRSSSGSSITHAQYAHI
jgi:hypothetical protein